MSPHSKRQAFIVAALLALAPLCAGAADAAPVSNGARSRAVEPGTQALPIASRSGGAGISVTTADLAIRMAVDDATPSEGEAITFKVFVANLGPDDVTEVVVTDLLPSGLTYAGSTPSTGSYVSASGVWTIGALVNGDSASLALSATVDLGTAGATIANSASISANYDVDPDPLNNTASQAVRVQSADLALTMSVDNAYPAEHDIVTFTITLTRRRG